MYCMCASARKVLGKPKSLRLVDRKLIMVVSSYLSCMSKCKNVQVHLMVSLSSAHGQRTHRFHTP